VAALAGPALGRGRNERLLAPLQAAFCRRRLCGPVSGVRAGRGQFSPRRPWTGWSRGGRAEDWGFCGGNSFDPGRALGYMAGDDQQRPDDLERRAPACWACVRVVGG